MASNFIVVFLTLFSVSLGDDIFNFGRGAGIPSNAMPAGAAGSNAAFDPSNFPAQPSPNPKVKPFYLCGRNCQSIVKC